MTDFLIPERPSGRVETLRKRRLRGVAWIGDLSQLMSAAIPS